MKLDVPLFRQESPNDCFPTSSLMIFRYFGNNIAIEDIRELSEMESSGAVWSIAAIKPFVLQGFKAEFYSKTLTIDPQNYDLEFYKKSVDALNQNIKKLERLKSDVTKLGADLHEQTLTLNEILSKINRDCLAILLLNWGIVEHSSEQTGSIHAVPIVGYDDQFVYINEPSAYIKDYKIDRTTFDKARKAAGTDEDILFICKFDN